MQAIHDGVCVPAGHRKVAGWEHFFKEIGLELAEKPPQVKKKSTKTPGERLCNMFDLDMCTCV